MRIKFVFDDGSTVEVGENDWIGALAHYDLSNNAMWMESCHDKKALIQALSAGKVLSFIVGGREFSVDSGRIVEAKAIEDGKEVLLWRRAVKSRLIVGY